MNLALYKIYETFTSFKMLSVGCNYTVGQKLKKNQGTFPKIFILGSTYHTRLWLVKNRLALSGSWIIYLGKKTTKKKPQLFSP